MIDRSIRLWTWQSRNWSLLNGELDISRSEFIESVLKYRQACHRLSEITGIEKIVWCFTNESEAKEIPWRGRDLWEIEVPKHSVVAFVRSSLWLRIIDQCACTEAQRDAWRAEAAETGISDRREQRRYASDQCRAFFDRLPEPNECWDRLLLPTFPGEDVTAIIGHPIPEEWVIPSPPGAPDL